MMGKEVVTYERLLTACREIHGIYRPVDICTLLNVSSGVLGNWSARGLPPSRIVDIAKAVGTTVDYLIDGKLPISPLSYTKKEVANLESSPRLISLSDHPDLLEIERVRFKLSAGVSGYAIEHESGNGRPVFFRRDWFESNGYKPERLFAVRVSGASMEPSLWDGDLVVINTADADPRDGEVYAINYEGEMVIKRMRRDTGEWFATSDNSDQRRFAPKRCTEDVKLIGKVVYKQSERI